MSTPVHRSCLTLASIVCVSASLSRANAGQIYVGGACTLAKAIDAANTDTFSGDCVGAIGDDSIVLEADATYLVDTIASFDATIGATALPPVTTDITIVGNGATLVFPADTEARAFRVSTGGRLVIDGLTIEGADAGTVRDGGAFYVQGHLELFDGLVNGARARDGAGIFAAAGGVITLARTTFVNAVPVGEGTVVTTNGTHSITNSTFSGIVGTAIIDKSASAYELRNVTIYGTAVGTRAARVLGSIDVQSSLIVTAAGDAAFVGPGSMDIDESNIVVFPEDAPLGPLADHGGPVPTHALLADNPAIDREATTGGSCEDIDQRGVARPQGLGCDAGAYEHVPACGNAIADPGEMCDLGDFAAGRDTCPAGHVGTPICNNDPAAGGTVSGPCTLLTVPKGCSNNPPIARNDTTVATEDQATVIAAGSLLANDEDPPENVLLMGTVDNAVNGTVEKLGDGSIRFVPAPNFNSTQGVASFRYTLLDPGGASAQATVTVTVNKRPDAPEAIADSLPGTEDTTLQIPASTLAVNDTDPDRSDVPPEALTVSAVSNSLGGTAVLAGGLVTFVPTLNRNDSRGPSGFDYTLTDASGQTDIAHVTIALAAANDTPTITSFAVTIAEDLTRALQPSELLATASDIDLGDTPPDVLVVDSVSNPTNGLIVALDAGFVRVTPPANYSGLASFSLTIRDQAGATATTTVNVTVQPVNDPPSFTIGSAQTTLEDAGAVTVPGFVPLASVSPGPTQEATQAVTFETSTNKPELFAVVPAVAPDGRLTFTPATNANGPATITVRAKDDGGTLNGGVDRSPPQTVDLTIVPVNDRPSFTSGGDVQVNEDTGLHTRVGWASAITTGPPDESTQTVTFAVDVDTPDLFSQLPTIAPNGTLIFATAPDRFGIATVTVVMKDNGGTANGGIDSTAPTTFIITIVDVSDPPTFAGGPDVTVLEDSGDASIPGWATAIEAAPQAENPQLVFEVTAVDTSLFATQPRVDAADGTLTFRPLSDAYGTTQVTVVLVDANASGPNRSEPFVFDLTIDGVNDAPFLQIGGDVTVLEDSVGYESVGWASALSPGPTNEASQSIEIDADNDQPQLFAAQPEVAVDGTLRLRPALNANGVAIVTVQVADDGGSANGGVARSPARTFQVTIVPVNDKPTFAVGPDITVIEDSGAFSTPWATNLSAGPADESGQNLHFEVHAENAELFSEQPAIDPGGRLGFSTAANQSGTTTVTVVLVDDGGVAGGGLDRSVVASFTITITNVSDEFLRGTGAGCAGGSGGAWLAGLLLVALAYSRAASRGQVSASRRGRALLDGADDAL